MLNLGMNLQRLAAKQVEFTPASLFNNGEAGVWYDPSAASGSLDWRKNLLEYTESFDNSAWVKTGASVTANDTTAPDGTTTADKLIQNSSAGFHYINRAYAVSDYTLITNSIHAKAGEYNYLYIFGNNHTTGSSSGTVVNLTNGTIVTNGHDAVVESKGNGWYRVSTKHYKTSSLTLNTYVTQTSSPASEAGDGTSGIYIWGAQLEEASTASSYQPILSTFANAFKAAFPSHTLYQDSNGETPVTAVGEPVGLMLDKSKGLAQGPELVTNGTFDSGVNGWTLREGNGTFSASSGVATLTYVSNPTSWVTSLSGITAGKTYTLSFNLVSASTSSVQFFYNHGSGGDLTVSMSNTAGTYSATFTAATSTATVFPRIYGAGNMVIDNVSVKEIQGSHATQPTSTKRPIYARHPEGGIRNLLNYTEQFDNGYWSKSFNASVSAGEVDPNGGSTAFKYNISAPTGRNIDTPDNLITGGKTYTFSLYVKAITNTIIRLRQSGNSAFVEDVSITTAQGWQRISLTFTANSALRVGFYDISGSTGDMFYIWGAQVEEATEASNYQKVVTDIDVTESGVGEVYYLKFDGTDDSMFINNLTSGNTPVTTLFGYSATNAESTTSKYLLDIQTGRTVFAASANTVGYIGYWDGSWRAFDADAAAIKVLTFDLVEDDAKIRVDGTQEYSDTTYDQQAIGGNIALFAKYDGIESCLGGNMYQTILRAAESTDEEIAKAETYVANKTGLKAQVDGIATLDLNFGANLYTAKNSNGGVI